MTTALVHVPRPEDDPEHRSPNTKIPRSVQRLRAAERRVRVAELLLRQTTQREIARIEHVGLGTVGDDVRAIKAMWAERAGAAYDVLVGEETAKLDALERTWFGLAMDGYEKAAGVYLRIMERRAKLHGLDQPAKAEIKVEHVEVEARRERARELLETAAADDELARRRGA